MTVKTSSSPTSFETAFRGLAVHRRALVIALHVVLAALSLCVAFLLRFDFGPLSGNSLQMLRMALPFAVGLELLALWHFGALSGLWRYVGIADLVQIIKAVTISSLAFVVAGGLTLGHGFPRSIFLLDYVLTIVLFGGSRLCVRPCPVLWGWNQRGVVREGALPAVGRRVVG
jgi:FlaA1/EpsC-like NDP-sugar epimerase